MYLVDSTAAMIRLTMKKNMAGADVSHMAIVITLILIFF